MNYRILLMVSGFFMMFTIFGYVMTVGALVDESDVWIGNFILGSICFILTLGAFVTGLRLRKQVHKQVNMLIEQLFAEHGHVEAVVFAKGAQVSLDDARDMLDRRMHIHGWKRTEMLQYNALYHR